MKHFKLITIVLTLLIIPAVSHAAQIVAVEFYADWCPKCKALEPTVDGIQKDFKKDSITFKKFDLTDDSTKSASLTTADELGIKELYQKTQKTGFVLLVDRDTKRVVGRLDPSQSPDQMRDTIKAVLAGVPLTPPEFTVQTIDPKRRMAERITSAPGQ